MFSFRIARISFGVFIFSLFFAASTLAQSVTGSISGTVTDPSGGIIPGATVTLVSEQTAASRNVVTNEEGRFQFSTLQPGAYTIKIEHTGFQTMQRTNIVLSANESLALGNVALTAGNINEVVTVASEGATVELESSDLTARLTSDQIDLISTKGRDITSLLRLIPGTTNENDVESVGEGFGTDLPFISGQRGRSTVPTVDGLNAGEPSGSNKLSMTINQDAVAEVKILRNNYAAEYGNNGGAIINIISKGGGKHYKGSAYYFLRNEALNANQFFNNKSGLPRPLYRHDIWGFNYGGPLPLLRFGENDHMLLKNKAFFFVSYERPHTIQPTNPVFVTVPTALEREGDFSQTFNTSGQLVVIRDRNGTQYRDPSRSTPSNPLGLNIIPRNLFDPSTAAFLNVFPLPNAPQGTRTLTGTQYNYVVQKSAEAPKHSFVIRFDVKPTKNDSVYWKGQWFTSDNIGLDTSGWDHNDRSRWGILSHYLYKDNGWSANWAHVFSKSIVNEFNIGMRHDSEGFIPDESTLPMVLRSSLGYDAPQLFPENNPVGLIPRVTDWGGIPGVPAQIRWLDRWGNIGEDYVRPAFSDNLSIIHSRHNFKFGMYYERMLNGEAAGANRSGTFSFTNSTSSGWNTAAGNTGNAYANAIVGRFRSYTETQFTPHTDIEMRMLQWYAQDQWKVARNLSLSYGMRFGWHTPYYQRNGVGSSFDPALWNPANAVVLYVPYCTGNGATPGVGIPPIGTACASGNQRAIDPRVLVPGVAPPASQLLAASFVRSLIPGVGDPLNGLHLARDPNTPKGYRQFALIDYEPRVGFAYDISGKAKTVLRAMAGIYHTPRAGGGTTGDLTGNPPEQRTWTINNGEVANLAALAIQARNNELVFPFGAIRGLETQSHTPEIYNFSVGVQQDLGFGTVIEASYVGSRARWLGEQRNINAVPDSSRFVDCGLAASFSVPCHAENRDPFNATAARNNDFLRPYVGYGDINYVTWSGNSKYDSLQVQMNRRYAQGFQYGLAYTWSKSMDVTSDDRDGLVFTNGTVFGGRDYLRYNYAPSDFDQRHVFTVNYIYDIPFFKKAGNSFVKTLLGGWQISGTTSFATGKPKDVSVTYEDTAVNVTNGQGCPAGSVAGAQNTTTGVTTCTPITDFTGGSVNALPFVTCDPTHDVTGTDNTSTPLFLNVDCFNRPTRLGEIGDRVRNLSRRPHIFNTDIALFKNFRWGEKRSIQLRWETYNVFNKSNFSDIDAGLTYELAQINPGALANPGATPPACSATNVCRAEYRQTNSRFGAATATRQPRVMQGSIRINF